MLFGKVLKLNKMTFKVVFVALLFILAASLLPAVNTHGNVKP